MINDANHSDNRIALLHHISISATNPYQQSLFTIGSPRGRIWLNYRPNSVHLLHLTSHTVIKTTGLLIRFRSFDVMDSMLHKLEKYADSLEHVVQQRTADLMDEKRKTDMLLYRMLPPYAPTYYEARSQGNNCEQGGPKTQTPTKVSIKGINACQ